MAPKVTVEWNDAKGTVPTIRLAFGQTLSTSLSLGKLTVGSNRGRFVWPMAPKVTVGWDEAKGTVPTISEDVVFGGGRPWGRFRWPSFL